MTIVPQYGVVEEHIIQDAPVRPSFDTLSDAIMNAFSNHDHVVRNFGGL